MFIFYICYQTIMCTILYYIMFLCIICHCSNKLFHIIYIISAWELFKWNFSNRTIHYSDTSPICWWSCWSCRTRCRRSGWARPSTVQRVGGTNYCCWSDLIIVVTAVMWIRIDRMRIQSGSRTIKSQNWFKQPIKS